MNEKFGGHSGTVLDSLSDRVSGLARLMYFVDYSNIVLQIWRM